MPTHIRKGDRVVVRAGKDAAGAPLGEATGEVMRVMPAKGLVIVSGLHYVRKHVRPSQRNTRGGRLQKESPIHISNVMLVDPASGDASRTRLRWSPMEPRSGSR